MNKRDSHLGIMAGTFKNSFLENKVNMITTNIIKSNKLLVVLLNEYTFKEHVTVNVELSSTIISALMGR